MLIFIPKKKILFLIVLNFFSLIIFSSCATTPQLVDKDPTELLKETATQYWNLRMADRYEETYKMEHKEGLPSYAEYLNIVMLIKKFTIVGHSIKDIKVEGDKGFVEVEFSFILPPVTKPFKQIIKDEWIFEGVRWLHKLPK